MTDAKILIVEDDESDAAHLEECLENLGYAVCDAVSCGREAIEKAADMRPDLALVDLRLKGELTGIETAEQIGSRFDVPVVYLTDEAEGDLLQRAQATNSFGYVLRPFEAPTAPEYPNRRIYAREGMQAARDGDQVETNHQKIERFHPANENRIRQYERRCGRRR